jgi:hypothetical protein
MMEDCMTLSEKSQREIRKIAYALWMQEGQPEGRDKEHWEAAKEIWAFRSHNHALPDEGAASEPASSDASKRRQPADHRPM